jgi:putative component of membrane protein insertase Oxa1/YidC/SpoIIIJ protein YidD
MFKLLSVSFQNQWSRMFIFVITSWQLFLFRINEAECLFLLSPPDNCFFSESMKLNVYFCCHLLTIVSFQNQWSRMFIFLITSWQLFLVRINEAECLFFLSPPDNCFFSESMKPNVYFCCHLLTIITKNKQ